MYFDFKTGICMGGVDGLAQTSLGGDPRTGVLELHFLGQQGINFKHILGDVR